MTCARSIYFIKSNRTLFRFVFLFSVFFYFFYYFFQPCVLCMWSSPSVRENQHKITKLICLFRLIYILWICYAFIHVWEIAGISVYLYISGVHSSTYRLVSNSSILYGNFSRQNSQILKIMNAWYCTDLFQWHFSVISVDLSITQSIYKIVWYATYG